MKIILDAIASYKKDILDFTERLIAVPTENPPGAAYSACVEIICEELDKTGLKSQIIDTSGSKDQKAGYPRKCITSFYGRGNRTFYFHGHYDVVPGKSSGQFKPVLKKGKLSGRGASDMKGGLASMVYAVKAIKECKINLGGKIGLVFVPDEETGGLMGSRRLLKKNVLAKNGIGMITPEPTSGVIWNANRGALSLKVTVRGKAAHVGRHYEGVNAFENMLTAANRLLKLKRSVAKKKTLFNIAPEMARSSILLIGGKCEGGTNFNIVPDEICFTVDRRINPEEDLDEEKKRLFSIFWELKRSGIDIEVEVVQESRAAGFAEQGPVAQALAKSVREVTGIEPRFEMCPGLLETRFYAEKAVPAYAYGPGLFSASHGPGEFIPIKNIYDCAAIYALTALKLLGKDLFLA